MTTKAPTQTLEVNTEFDVGSLREFIDSGAGSHGETNLQIETGRNILLPLPDRRRLMDIEIFLTNCLNLAQAVESKEMAKAIQLLREARDEIKRGA